jgi:large subunit ribosomal protein L17
MRHGNTNRKLSRTASHRKAMFANMSAALIKHEQIVTTLPKAKELRPIVEKLVTLGKRGDLHARRHLAASRRGHGEKLRRFGAALQAAGCGYTRVKAARHGDSAPMAVIELVGATGRRAERPGPPRGRQGHYARTPSRSSSGAPIVQSLRRYSSAAVGASKAPILLFV